MTSIWRRVLNRPSIGVDDNFFDVGGNPSLASELFAEIAQAFGPELPPTVIYSAPTIAALADVLDQSAPPPPLPLILLKPGVVQPPVFIAHGLGGSVMEFFELVKHMRTHRTIYGLQAKGSDGRDLPFARIEEMAQFHVDAIRNVQTRGPYTLVGYSLGGLVAFEIARQLRKAGEKIQSLAMIDSYPHTERLACWNRVQLASTLLRYRISDLVQLSTYRSVRVSLSHSRARARFSDFVAWTRYRPSFYDGELGFIRAASSHFPDPAPIWGRLAAKITIQNTPGDHHAVLSTHSADLASLLTSLLSSPLLHESI